MDGGGSCLQRRSGQPGTDLNCSCPFCTEDRLASKFQIPSEFSARLNGGRSGEAVVGEPRAERAVPDASSVIRAEMPHGDSSKEVIKSVGRSRQGQVPDRKLQGGESARHSSTGRRSLVSLCVGYLGQRLEDLIDDIDVIAPAFPPQIKGKLLAIARRRGLLCDELLVALADNSWEILDVSGSDVTDFSLMAAASTCPRLQVVDISRCSGLTPAAVRSLVQGCPCLRTLRCGGTSMSDAAARGSLSYILPRLNRNEEAEESWEVLDTKPVGKGAQALRWIVWPSIDSKSRERLAVECPRIVVNPIISWKTYGLVPSESQPGMVLDSLLLEDIDPKTWAVVSSSRPLKAGASSAEHDDKLGLSVAERFRLAFVSRDERLAPKRAKNMRQNQRRAEKAWLSSDTEAKAQVWAGIARKSLKNLAL